MNVYTLNLIGQSQVRNFIQTNGIDCLDPDVWFMEAEGTAVDGFEHGLSMCIELQQRYSQDRKPHTLTLQKEWFDVLVLDDDWWDSKGRAA